VARMKKRYAIRLFCLAAMLILCIFSAQSAKQSEEHVHQPMWFVLSVPGATYLLLSLARSGELAIGRKGRCRTG